MNWLVLVILSAFASSVEIFIDNYISDCYFKGRDAVAQKFFYGFSGVFLGVLLLTIFGVDFSIVDPITCLLIFVSGLCSSLAGIFYYRALEIDDSTNLGIFIQLAPVLYLIFGWFLLGDTFEPMQLVAFAVILAAPLLIVLSSRKRSRKTKIRAILFAFIYILISTLGNILFVKIAKENAATEALSFPAEMAFVYLGKGIGNFIIIAFRPKWRKRFVYVFKHSKARVLRPLFASWLLGIASNFAYRFSLTIAPSVALASAASDSAEPIIIFFLGLVLTLLWPRFGREKMDRKTIMVHLAATILVVIGIVLIQNFS